MAERPTGTSVQTGKALPPVRRPTTIPRSCKTHLEEQGWRLSFERGKVQLTGWYRSLYGSWAGLIQNVDSSKPSYFIIHPPDELRLHPHWPCFTPRPDMGEGVYSIHFSEVPGDFDSGVMHLERVLNESFLVAKNIA